MRVAFLSPLPPAATGIADYAADVLAALAPANEIDVFHDQAEVDTARLPPSCGVYAEAGDGLRTARSVAARRPDSMAAPSLRNT